MSYSQTEIQPDPEESRKVRAERRARLIDTAIRLFSERPYAEVSVEDIATDAGVATGLLYYHFTDKQGLYVAGLEVLAEQLKAQIEQAVDPSADPLTRLLAGLDAHLAFVERHPTGYRELLSGAASHPRVRAIIEREREARLGQLVEGLPREIEPTPSVMATLEGWLHFVEGVQLAWLAKPTLDRSQVSRLCTRVLAASISAAVQFDHELTTR